MPRPSVAMLPRLVGVALAMCACSGAPQTATPAASTIECNAETQCAPYHACIAGSCVALLDPPGNVQATPGTNTIDLSWDPRPGATSYALSAALQQTPDEWVKLGEGAGTRVRIIDIPPDRTVYVVIQSVNGSGAGRPSAPVFATTAIDSLRVAGAGTSLVLNWTTVQVDPHFDVYRASSANGPFALVAAAAQSPWADQNLGDGQTRWYQVRPSGGGADSNAASATTRPPPPTGLTGTSDSFGDVLFSWQAAAGASVYVVHTATRPSSFSSGTTSGTSVLVPISPRGGPGRYRASVTARNDAGESDPSEVITGLSAPSFRNAFAGPGVTHLELEPGGNGSIAVERALSPAGPWSPVVTMPISGFSLQIADVDAPGWTTVWYRAQGIDPEGRGDFSFATLQTFGPPDISNPAPLPGSGCERWTSFDVAQIAEQGFTPGVTGTLMGLQASVSVQFAGATVEAHVLDAAGNDLGHATVPSTGSCPQPLSEIVSIMYADFSQSGVRVVAGTPLRLQLRVVGPPGAFAFAGITADAYPGVLAAPRDAAPPDGQDLILRTFVKADAAVVP